MTRKQARPAGGRRPASALKRGAGVRKKKSEDTPSPQPSETGLIPGLRQRLELELERAGIPPRQRVSTLCRMTSRTRPTVTRWVDASVPGLPDLESFTVLCRQLRVDSNYLLGLTRLRLPLPGGQAMLDRGADWLDSVRKAAAPMLEHCDPVIMRGDDMEPAIEDGDLLFVDRRVTALAGNGVYVVEYLGRTMVRIVEDRLSDGLVLRCANERYADVAIPMEAVAASDLRILGKVLRRLCIEPI